MIKPSQASEALNIPPSTLRRLAKEFENYLSPQTGSHRSYTLEDLDTFRKIHKMLSSGMTYKEAKDKLQIIDPSENEVTDLAIVPEIINQLTLSNEIINDLQNQIDKLKIQDQNKTESIIKMNQKLEKLESLYKWDRLPWYKKIFIDPSDYFNPTSDKDINP